MANSLVRAPGRAANWALGIGLLVACHHGGTGSETHGQESSAGQEAPAAPAAAPSAPETAPPAVEGAKLSCANVRCMAGTHCEMIQVQCVRAPCDPVPECKADTASGQGQRCGKNLCTPDQTCCNASCGICAAPGSGCIKLYCPDGQLPGH